MKALFYLFLFISLYSCNTTTHKHSNSTIPKVKFYTDIQNDIGELMNIIDSTTIIELEIGDNDEVLIDIDDVLFYDNDLFVVDNRGCQIIKYDSCGNYIFSINRTGRGRGEYIRFSDATIINNSIYVLDAESAKILKYSVHDGHFIDQIKIDRRLTDEMKSSDDHLILFNKNFPSQSSDYNILVYDTLGTFKYECMPILPVNIGSPYGLANYLFKSNDELFINNNFEEYIYKMGQTGIDSVYCLDYGNSAIPKSVLRSIAKDDKKGSVSLEKYSMGFNVGVVTSNYIIGTSSYYDQSKNMSIFSIVNRVNNKMININMDNNILPMEYRWFVAAENNIAYSIVNSLLYLITDNESTSIDPSFLREHFADAESRLVNPLLIKTSLKNSDN